MNKNDLEFDVVSVEQNNLQSFIVFRVNQISSIVRKTNVGQFIPSCSFELNFPATIGKSKWTVLLFPNGQYEGGHPNDMINIYLKLVHCEHQSAEFKFDVTFQVGSNRAKVTKKNKRICFADTRTRWIGTSLIRHNDLIVNGSGLIQDDVLVLSAQLDEHLTESSYNYGNGSFVKSETDIMESPCVTSAEASYNEIFWLEKEQCEKAEKMNIDSPECSKDHISSAEEAYNLLINKKEQFNKTDERPIDTPMEHSTLAATSYNNDPWIKKEPECSKDHESSAETAFNCWMNKEQANKTDERTIDTPMEHSLLAGTSYNNDPWIKKDHASLSETAFNYWMKKEQVNKTEKRMIDTPEEHLPRAATSYNNDPWIEKNPFETIKANLPQQSRQSSTIQSDDIFRSTEPQNSTTGRDSATGSDLMYHRNVIRDSDLDFVNNEFSDDEDETKEPKSLMRRLWDKIKKQK